MEKVKQEKITKAAVVVCSLLSVGSVSTTLKVMCLLFDILMMIAANIDGNERGVWPMRPAAVMADDQG